MNPYDVTPDDEPLDVRAVSEDDLLVERLRHALSPEDAVVWDEDEDDSDPGYALLRALQRDVAADLLVGEPILPAPVIELAPRRRRLSRAAAVATVAAGVLSIGGVAAASAPGAPLAGVRHTVTHAVEAAVHAVTPDAPAEPKAEPSDSPSAKPTPPGDAVSAAARSASAVRQIQANLARAGQLIDDGRYEPAKNQLDAAARKLDYVLDPTVKADLQNQLTALQARLAAMPTAKPTDKPTKDPSGQHGKSGEHGKSGDHSNQGNHGDATQKPTALPTHAPKATKAPHTDGDATPAAVESADSHKRGGN